MIYRVLEHPSVYNLIQKLSWIGRGRVLKSIEELIRENCSGRVLDIGCGPRTNTHILQSDYVGMDINPKYLKGISGHGRNFVCGDGTMLPFKENTFDSVMSVFFFHHIAPVQTRAILEEILRVGKPNVRMLLIDNFLPEGNLNLIGATLVALDRGKHVRDRESFMRELEECLRIESVHTIEGAFPYNTHALRLTIR